MRAKILSKKLVAESTQETVYDLLGKNVSFKPGQLFYLTLPGGLKHHFTIVNSPNETGILTNTTRLRDTEFKNTLKKLPVGAEVEVEPIGGNFTLPEGNSKPLVFIALGIGITPYISMLRFVGEKKENDKITLIYSDSNQKSMAYFNELEAYTKDNPNFKIILTVTRDEKWTGEKRHIDESFIRDYIKNLKDNLYYISGPPGAVEAVVKALENIGIEKSGIKSENFSGY